MHEAWAAGDRAGAAAAIPDQVVDDLVVHGAPEACAERVAQYVAAGVRTPTIALMPTPDGAPNIDLLRRLGPVQ
jgi:alkanesulfonate monooxygenase SsuD/methylene tetrahydromethanopterin reductase-like flavin-dependent oxidoreductase (luciferase family)